MDGLTAGERASTTLLARKEDFARRITAALYAEDPRLLAEHGERGRAKCLQDMRYNLEHLAPALALDEPAMFVGYVRWLADLLAAYGVQPGDVRRSLERTREVLQAELPADEAAAASVAIDAGLGSLLPVVP